MQKPFTTALKEKRYGIIRITNKALYANPELWQKIQAKLLILEAKANFYHHYIEYKFTHPFLQTTLPTQKIPVYNLEINADHALLKLGDKISGRLNF